MSEFLHAWAMGLSAAQRNVLICGAIGLIVVTDLCCLFIGIMHVRIEWRKLRKEDWPGKLRECQEAIQSTRWRR